MQLVSTLEGSWSNGWRSTLTCFYQFIDYLHYFLKPLSRGVHNTPIEPYLPPAVVAKNPDLGCR